MHLKKLYLKLFVVLFMFTCLMNAAVFADNNDKAMPEIGVSELKELIIQNSIDIYDINQSIYDIEDSIDQFNDFKTFIYMGGDTSSGSALEKKGPFYDYAYPNFIFQKQLQNQLDSLNVTKDTLQATLLLTTDSLISQVALLEGQRELYNVTISQSEKLFKSAALSQKLGKITTNELKKAENDLANLKLDKTKLDKNIMILKYKLMSMAGMDKAEDIRFVPVSITGMELDMDKYSEYLKIAEESSLDVNMAKNTYNMVVDENKYVESYKNFVSPADQIYYKKKLFDAEVTVMKSKKTVHSTLSNIYSEIKALNEDVAINEAKVSRSQKLYDEYKIRYKNGSAKETDLMSFEMQLMQSRINLQNAVENRNLALTKASTLLNSGIIIQGGF